MGKCLSGKNNNTIFLLLIFFPKPALILLCCHLLSGFLCSYTARVASAAVFGVVVYLHYVCAKVIWIHSKFLPMPWIWGKCHRTQVWSPICRSADGEKELGGSTLLGGVNGHPQVEKNWADIQAKSPSQLLPAHPRHTFPSPKLNLYIISMR